MCVFAADRGRSGHHDSRAAPTRRSSPSNKFTGDVKWATQSDKAGYSSPLAVDAAGRRQILMFTGRSLLSVAPEDGSAVVAI